MSNIAWLCSFKLKTSILWSYKFFYEFLSDSCSTRHKHSSWWRVQLNDADDARMVSCGNLSLSPTSQQSTKSWRYETIQKQCMHFNRFFSINISNCFSFYLAKIIFCPISLNSLNNKLKLRKQNKRIYVAGIKVLLKLPDSVLYV